VGGLISPVYGAAMKKGGGGGSGDLRAGARAPPVAPDGGYGWIVMLGSFGIHIVVDGIAFTFGVLYGEFLDYFGEGKGKTSFVGSVLSGVYLMSGMFAQCGLTLQRRTGPPGCLKPARWAGWSGVQVGRHVKC